MNSSLRTDEEIEKIYNRHVDTVYRICFSFLKNAADAEDMVQETFLKLILSERSFLSAQHEKAWLIVTASNACKDALRRRRFRAESLDDVSSMECKAASEENGILPAILSLPVKYKEALFLYYYEGYQTNEIAKMLRCSGSTVRSRLARARKLLKKKLKKMDEAVAADERRDLRSV